jgi:hypothetical protein
VGGVVKTGITLLKNEKTKASAHGNVKVFETLLKKSPIKVSFAIYKGL